MTLYEQLSEAHQKLQARHITEEEEVYPVLRELFERE